MDPSSDAHCTVPPPSSFDPHHLTRRQPRPDDDYSSARRGSTAEYLPPPLALYQGDGSAAEGQRRPSAPSDGVPGQGAGMAGSDGRAVYGAVHGYEHPHSQSHTPSSAFQQPYAPSYGAPHQPQYAAAPPPDYPNTVYAEKPPPQQPYRPYQPYDGPPHPSRHSYSGPSSDYQNQGHSHGHPVAFPPTADSNGHRYSLPSLNTSHLPAHQHYQHYQQPSPVPPTSIFHTQQQPHSFHSSTYAPSHPLRPLSQSQPQLNTNFAHLTHDSAPPPPLSNSSSLPSALPSATSATTVNSSLSTLVEAATASSFSPPTPVAARRPSSASAPNSPWSGPPPPQLSLGNSGLSAKRRRSAADALSHLPPAPPPQLEEASADGYGRRRTWSAQEQRRERERRAYGNEQTRTFERQRRASGPPGGLAQQNEDYEGEVWEAREAARSMPSSRRGSFIVPPHLLPPPPPPPTMTTARQAPSRPWTAGSQGSAAFPLPPPLVPISQLKEPRPSSDDLQPYPPSSTSHPRSFPSASTSASMTASTSSAHSWHPYPAALEHEHENGSVSPAVSPRVGSRARGEKRRADVGEEDEDEDEDELEEEGEEEEGEEGGRRGGRETKGKKGGKKEKPVKKFPCPHPACGRLFARNYNLQSHIKSHRGVREFKCPLCEKLFSRKHDCTRHCIAIHNMDPTELAQNALRDPAYLTNPAFTSSSSTSSSVGIAGSIRFPNSHSNTEETEADLLRRRSGRLHRGAGVPGGGGSLSPPPDFSASVDGRVRRLSGPAVSLVHPTRFQHDLLREEPTYHPLQQVLPSGMVHPLAWGSHEEALGRQG